MCGGDPAMKGVLEGCVVDFVVLGFLRVWVMELLDFLLSRDNVFLRLPSRMLVRSFISQPFDQVL